MADLAHRASGARPVRCARHSELAAGRSPNLECLPEGHLPFLNNGAGTQYFQALISPVKAGPRISRKDAPRCASMVLFPIVKLLWRSYMRVGIEAVEERTEREAL